MADLIRCRVTVNLQGTRAGHVVLADPDDEYTRVCLERGYLVPVEAPAGAAHAPPLPVPEP